MAGFAGSEGHGPVILGEDTPGVVGIAGEMVGWGFSWAGKWQQGEGCCGWDGRAGVSCAAPRAQFSFSK